MKHFTWAALFLPFCLGGCITDIQPQYKGAGGGYLVIAMGQTTGTLFMNYGYSYTGQTDECGSGPNSGDISYDPGNSAVIRKPDFINTEGSGIVEVIRLQPGDYALCNIGMLNDNGMSRQSFSFRKDFSIPFTIKSGEAAYVGHYMAQEVMGRNIFYMPVPAGARFLISDQLASDIKIARTPRLKVYSLPGDITTVTDDTPDPSTLKHPMLVHDPMAPAP